MELTHTATRAGRLSSFLREEMGLSAGLMNRLKWQQLLFVNGKPVHTDFSVQPGDVIGFMGRTGYSDRENVNNIETVHLHFGVQLVFDESQKECNSEIWIDVYPIVKLLSQHRSSTEKVDGVWQRKYPFVDLDTQTLFEQG